MVDASPHTPLPIDFLTISILWWVCQSAVNSPTVSFQLVGQIMWVTLGLIMGPGHLDFRWIHRQPTFSAVGGVFVFDSSCSFGLALLVTMPTL